MRAVLGVGTALFAILIISSASSQPSCGDPPRVDDQTLKGDLEGKAQFLSKLVSDANLKGQIETARTDIFSKYPNADKTRSTAYLQYMFCTFVLSDPRPSWQEKADAFQVVFFASISPPSNKKQATISAIEAALFDLRLIIIDKGGYLFPDTNDYMNTPSKERWNIVIADAKRQLRIVEKAVESVESYHATLADSENGTLAVLHNDLRKRIAQLGRLIDSTNPLPNRGAVSRWASDYGGLVYELQTGLTVLEQKVKSTP